MTTFSAPEDDYDVCTHDALGGFVILRGIGTVGHYTSLTEVLQRLAISKYVYGIKISNKTLQRIGKAIREQEENTQWHLNNSK